MRDERSGGRGSLHARRVRPSMEGRSEQPERHPVLHEAHAGVPGGLAAVAVLVAAAQHAAVVPGGPADDGARLPRLVVAVARLLSARTVAAEPFAVHRAERERAAYGRACDPLVRPPALERPVFPSAHAADLPAVAAPADHEHHAVRFQQAGARCRWQVVGQHPARLKRMCAGRGRLAREGALHSSAIRRVRRFRMERKAAPDGRALSLEAQLPHAVDP